MSTRLSIWNCPLSNHDEGGLERLVKLNIFTYTQLVFLDFNIPMINRRMDKGDFKHYMPLKHC